MEEKSLREHIDYLIHCTENLSISTEQTKKYKKSYENIAAYCEAKGLETFTFDDVNGFLAVEAKDKKYYYFKQSRKIAYTTAHYFEHGEFEWKTVTVPNYPISKEYMSLVDEFRLELLALFVYGTVRTIVGIVCQFLNYVECLGIKSVGEITNEDVFAFIRQEAPRHKQTMSSLIRSVRKFIVFLRNKNLINLTADRFLTEAGRRREKSLPCFSDEDLQLIFRSIDRTTDKGRRNYAVFLLALRTGLRASDIANLKLTDIDWQNNTLIVVQKKTGVAIELPLPIDAGNAIAEYILNSRYETDNPFVFLGLRCKSTLAPIDPNSFNQHLQFYIKASGLCKKGWDGKSFHALRRTAGTRMIESDTPITTVAQVLGHSSIESSKRYISLDVNKLSDCAMDLGNMTTRKEGLT